MYVNIDEFNRMIGVTRFVYDAKMLYFLSENHSIFGSIDIEKGNVKYYDDAIELLSGDPAYKSLTFCWMGQVYILLYNKQKLVRFDPKTQVFSVVDNLSVYNMDVSWAGWHIVNGVLYAVLRKCNKVYIYDLVTGEGRFEQLEVKEDIIWSCMCGDDVFLLTSSCDVIYVYDIKNGDISEVYIGLSKRYELFSLTPFKVHNMVYDGGFLYIHDAQSIYRISLKGGRVEKLYESSRRDNSSRLIICQKSIIVSPFRGSEFYILNKEDGKCIAVESYDKDILFSDTEGSRVGVPVEDAMNIYVPIVNANVMLVIHKESMDFLWKFFKKSSSNKVPILGKLAASKVTIFEDSFFNLLSFLSAMN